MNEYLSKLYVLYEGPEVLEAHLTGSTLISSEGLSGLYIDVRKNPDCRARSRGIADDFLDWPLVITIENNVPMDKDCFVRAVLSLVQKMRNNGAKVVGWAEEVDIS